MVTLEEVPFIPRDFYEASSIGLAGTVFHSKQFVLKESIYLDTIKSYKKLVLNF